MFPANNCDLSSVVMANVTTEKDNGFQREPFVRMFGISVVPTIGSVSVVTLATERR